MNRRECLGLLAAAARLNALMVKSGLLASADDLSELVTDRYLPREALT